MSRYPAGVLVGGIVGHVGQCVSACVFVFVYVCDNSVNRHQITVLARWSPGIQKLKPLGDLLVTLFQCWGTSG